MSGTLQHEIGKRRPFEVPEEEAYLNLRRTVCVLETESGRLFKGHGLSESTYNILRILRGESRSGGPMAAGVPTQVIGERLIAQVPDVTRLVDRLVAAGLADRVRCTEDRRVVRVAITPQGLERLAALDEPVRQLHRRQLGHMSEEELGELNRLLTKARHPIAASPPEPGAPS